MVKLNKTSMVKVIVDNQLFIYYNGELIYKRWLSAPDRKAYGKVFHNGEGLSIGRK